MAIDDSDAATGAEVLPATPGQGIVSDIDHAATRLARSASRRSAATARAVRARLVQLRGNSEALQQGIDRAASARHVHVPVVVTALPPAAFEEHGAAGADLLPSALTVAATAVPASSAPQVRAVRGALARERRISRVTIALGAALAIAAGGVAYATSGNHTTPSPLHVSVAEHRTPSRPTAPTIAPTTSAPTVSSSSPADTTSANTTSATSPPARGTALPGSAASPPGSAAGAPGATGPAGSAPQAPPPTNTSPPPSSNPSNPLCQVLPILCR